MEADKAQIIQVLVNKKLTAIVYHDLETRNQVFYKVEKMDADEIKALLNTTLETKQ